MNILTQERNYLPIDIGTKLHACLRRVVSNWPIKKILSYYHVKRSSLYRWLKKFDGNKESLLDRSHKPLSDHPKKLKTAVINKVLNLHRRNPDSSFIELWVRLKYEGLEISPSSVLRIFKKNNEFIKYKPNPKNTIKSILLQQWYTKNGK